MKAIAFIKKEPMLALSLLAAAIGFIITPPSLELIGGIDWRTLGTLLMMLTVLEGFKKENVLYPVVRLGSKLGRMTSLTLFLVFGVFFSSMFVTNDVSLLIFVPLTITLFRAAGKEKYILPVISMENIAAIRGSLLMPFGSPQNLFLYGKAEASLGRFMLHMSPLCVMSAVLLVAFIFFLYRKDPRESAAPEEDNGKEGENWRLTPRRGAYLALFAVVLTVIVTRTSLWPYALAIVLIGAAIADIKLFLRVDYVLLVTFLCFFLFSSSIANNPAVAAFLQDKIRFTDIYTIIEETMSKSPHVDCPSYQDYVDSNVDARARAAAMVETLSGKS